MSRLNKGANKREKRNRTIMGIVVIVIMVSSALAIINSGDNNTSSGNSVKYNGYAFGQQDSKWTVKVNGKLLAFGNHPLELESISVSQAIIQAITDSNPVVVTNNPGSVNREYIAAAQYELRQYTEIFFGKAFVNGFTINAMPDVPVVTCTNSTLQAPVILFEDSNVTSVSIDGGCIKVSAKYNTDYQKLVERILYSLIGIMK